MKQDRPRRLWLLLALPLALFALAAVVAIAAGMAALATDGIDLAIDADSVSITSANGGHWLLVIGALMLAALVVVPLALVAATVAFGCVAFALLLAGAVALAPLLALAALAWWIVRRRRRPA
jgi:hypothetical protein